MGDCEWNWPQRSLPFQLCFHDWAAGTKSEARRSFLKNLKDPRNDALAGNSSKDLRKLKPGFRMKIKFKSQNQLTYVFSMEFSGCLPFKEEHKGKSQTLVQQWGLGQLPIHVWPSVSPPVKWNSNPVTLKVLWGQPHKGFCGLFPPFPLASAANISRLCYRTLKCWGPVCPRGQSKSWHLVPGHTPNLSIYQLPSPLRPPALCACQSSSSSLTPRCPDPCSLL